MLNPRQQLIRARQAMDAGQTETARAIFRQILAEHPKSGETLFHLGRLELLNGAPKRAKKYLAAALKLHPKEPAIWTNLMDAEIALRDKKAIGKLLRNAKAAGLPASVLTQLRNKVSTGNKRGVARLEGITEAEFEQARSAYLAGRFDEARHLATRLLEKSPRTAPLFAILGASLAQTGNPQEAREAYEKAIEIDPEYFEAQLQLGQLLMGIGELEPAGKHLTRALELAKQSPHAHLSLGILQATLSNTKKAIEHLEIARKSLPDEPRLQLHLAGAYQAEARADEALVALEKAQKHDLDLPEQIILVRTLMEFDRIEPARALMAKLLAAHPDNVEVLSQQANLTMHIGDFDAMREAVRKLVDMGAASGDLLLNYARGGKMEQGDPVVLEIEKAYQDRALERDTRSGLGFALAKTYDDWGEYAKSFAALRAANEIERGEEPVKKSRKSQGFETIKTVFERSLPLWQETGATGLGDAHPMPIQITGMPRSGTTLVEQIVSSHSRVTPAGELGVLGSQLNEVLALHELEDKPLSQQDLVGIGENIVAAYAGLFPEAEFVTDKAIMSNKFTGIYARALPRARMVVLRRDPRDNCLSIYKNKFKTGSHRYSTDLEALAYQYLTFLDMQKYWAEQVPEAFYEIRYEDLIENPEEETRKLIEYCGLEWEDACLEFYKNKRQVKTLSAFQVRQKLYSSSVGAWKNYEEELQPLIRILDEGGALEGY